MLPRCSVSKKWQAATELIVLCFGLVALLFLGIVGFGPHQKKEAPAKILPQRQVSAVPAKTQSSLVASYGKLPLSFEINQGQTDSSVKFMSRGGGYTLFLTGDEAVLSLRKPGVLAQGGAAVARGVGPSGAGPWPNAVRPYHRRNTFAAETRTDGAARQNSLFGGGALPSPLLPASLDADNPADTQFEMPQVPSATALRMRLVGANSQALATGADELPGKSNYFIGNDPKKWRTNVPTYAKVKYKGVYPGIDLVYYGNQGGQLEYDFVVAPGADPGAIALDVGAVREPTVAAASDRRSAVETPPLQIAADGDLIIPTDDGEVRFHKPLIYQPVNRQSTIDNRKSVDGHFTLDAENRVRFVLGPHDLSRPLVIDPVLVYSTYLSGIGDDCGIGGCGNGIAVDASGSAYVSGETWSTNFPTVNPIQSDSNAAYMPDAFVTKFAPSGSALVYSTYLGGAGEDQANGIAVDASGDAYVTGYTLSVDFPTANPFQATLVGGLNAFVARLNATGSALVYSTYLGGSAADYGHGIAVDASGSAYVTGYTYSRNFPTANPFQAQMQSSASCNAFVTKFGPSGSVLVYSTYLGGSDFDMGNGIAVDSSGSAYVTGRTESTDFPTANPLQGSSQSGNVFVAKLGWNGSALSLVYSTHLGVGSGGDAGAAIAVDSSGNAYVTGSVRSNNFPVANPFQAQLGGVNAYSNAFVTKLGWNGSSLNLVYSTYLGGSNNDWGAGIAVDSSGNAHVAGYAGSSDFPVVNAIQAGMYGGAAFVAELDQAGSALVYSTFLGDDGAVAFGIASDASGNAYVRGEADSYFPTVNAFQPAALGADGDAFVAKISPANLPSASAVPSNLSFSPQYLGTTSGAETVTITNFGSVPLSVSNIAISGSSAFGQTNNCTSPLAPLAICSISMTFTPTAVGPQTGTLTITDNDSGTPGSTQTVNLTGTGFSALLGVSVSSLIFGGQVVGTTSASQSVVLSDPNSTAIAVGISTSANFGETNNCGSSLAANSSCTVSVTFSPTATGPYNGTLTITNSSGGVAGSTQTVTLSGTGNKAGAWVPGYQFLAAGSSAQFNTTALAALDPNANNLGGGRTACTEGNASQHWANTSGMAIHDPRGNPNISDETGSVWIGWDSDFITGMDYDMGINGVTIPPTGPGIICAYVSLDSVVGMREYFANGQFVLSATANAPDASNATVPGLPAGVNLPPEVVYFFNKLGPQVMNVAPTDIRPEDGKFATVRALTTQGVQMPGPPYAGLGYGPGPVGTAIKSNYPGSSKVMQVADFVIYPGDLDPISTLPPRSYSVSTVGAAPVLVIANTTQTGAGHLGNASYNQINKPVLADIFSGQTHEVRDIGNLGSSDPINTLTVFQREPLSDTYNVFDFSVTCAYDRFGSYGGPDYYRCQETNVNAATMNPLNLTYTISNGQTASRQRVIGTGEMAQAVCGPYNSTYPNGYPDSIGYISWGFANFKGINTNCKYLPVDSIDPLYAYLDANPSGVGAIPSCTWTQGAIGCPALPFTKIVDGGYPIWTMYRWVWAPGPYEYVGGVLPYVELVASSGYLTDFVPTANMLVFHQHYDQCVTDACQAQYGSNGVDATSLLGSTCGPSGNLACIEAEVGGDMGGKVLTINSEIDYTADHVKNGATSGCTTGAGGNWPDAGSPGVCEQTTIDLGNHRLPPW